EPPVSAQVALETYNNEPSIDQAFHQLSEAAQHMTGGGRNRRAPRASRLAPIYDVSADIQRHSTPLPKVSKVQESPQHEDLAKYSTQVSKVQESAQHEDLARYSTLVSKVQESSQHEDLARQIPDHWPWLQEADGDDDENDIWSNSTDPLMARHFPNSAEVARIEEEDLKRAIADGVMTAPLMPRHPAPHRNKRNIRTAITVFIILAMVFLIVDSVLVLAVFTHTQHTSSAFNGPPSLILSANVATVGQTIILHVRHFSSSSRVLLTHDIQENVQITKGSPLVHVGSDGSADVSMLVDTSWGPGFHTIEAEDVATRYTASATLQIAGAGPSRPSHLLIDTTTLDLGADIQGANTLQTLTLHNSGGGSISWSASSNQSWLLLSPTEGVFSTSQTITVAVERANLKPGDYKGTIAFSSNVGTLEWVRVSMTVRPLPPNVGAVLQITPPVLSFTALDGGTNPNSQALMISNPGTQPLNWSLASNSQINLASMGLLFQSLDPRVGWLSLDQTAGVVVPHGTSVIHANVNSRSLLAGVYTNMLVFNAGPAPDSPQRVSVSLTIQPSCGLTLNTGSISFTAVSGQSNPSNQSLTLSTTSSCAGTVSWKAISAANWLTVTPASGQLKSSASMVTAVGVNATILRPGTYASTLAFSTTHNTHTVSVQLVVQAPPPPSAPIMGATPLNLNFSTTQGMPNPPGQVVTITNTGGGPLTWRTTVNTLANSWLGVSPTGGSIPAGGTGQVTININTAGLSPNTYVGQIILNGADASGVTASGSPQTIMVNLLVLPPCAVQKPSLSSVAFSATQGGSDPSPQSVVITASGNCSWPLSWHATIANPPAWLKMSAMSGTFAASGQPVSLQLSTTITDLPVGTYTTSVSISAGDSSNTFVQGTPQVFTVTLTVLPPCALQMGATTGLSFTTAEGRPAPPAQNISFSEVGSCVGPFSWTVAASAGGNGWLGLNPTSGTGSGSVAVSVNAQGLTPGTYTAVITLTATGSGGAVVQGSPQNIAVNLTVSGYTLGGTVIACSDTSCTSSKPLPGATLNLVNTTTNQAISIQADSSGNYSFTNLALGSYTVTVTGNDGTNNYGGSGSVTITGTQIGFSVQVYPV
ncbi:MAG: BACON domain-containing protein, partial [Ktedonobacteraceae bacterium]